MGEAFFYAVLVGVILGLLFDVFRVPRIIFSDKFFFDFLFWLISTFVVFCYFLIFNSGALRMINFLLIFIGFLFYTFTIGYVTKQIEIRVAKKIKIYLKKVKIRLKSFKKVLHSMTDVYYNIIALVKKLFCKKSKGDDYDRESEQEEQEFFS